MRLFVGFVLQSESLKRGFLFRGFCASDHFLKGVQIILEGLATSDGQFVPGLGTRQNFLPISDITGLMQGAQMGDEIAVAHLEFGLEILEGPVRARGEQTHDGKSSLFMDHFIEPVEIKHARTRSQVSPLPLALLPEPKRVPRKPDDSRQKWPPSGRKPPGRMARHAGWA